MRRWWLPLAVLWGLAGGACADPPDAVCRIVVISGTGFSSGSGTVIDARPGASQVLTCAHLWKNRSGQPLNLASCRTMLDAPAAAVCGPRQVGVRLVALDHDRDLALLEVGAQLPYVCPVGTVTGRRLLSCGYDYAQGWPGVRKYATPLEQAGNWLFTAEAPVDGRSGGPLIDLDRGTVVGVCHGYQDLGPSRRDGIYVCLDSIRAFLGAGQTPQPAAPGFQMAPVPSYPIVPRYQDYLPPSSGPL
jgi:hypothetical protein